ncbi:MAG: hypothetical protein R2706_08830 [Acidimicrobiales bacterium]
MPKRFHRRHSLLPTLLIVWDGPVSNWLAACDRILELDCDVIVPGHGPLTDANGVQAVKDYLEFVVCEATSRHEDRHDRRRCRRRHQSGVLRPWLDAERIAINVDTVYLPEIDSSNEKRTNVIELFRQMAQIKLG